jgi:CheY-like chemotaxis protein
MSSCQSRILVVDDDPAMLGVLKTGLTRMGYEVLIACQGVEAMIQLHANEGNISAIVTDVDMPRMGGLELIRAARDAGFKGRIVIMSGRMAPHELKAIEDCRISGFFSKPFDVGILATMLRDGEPANDLA